MPPDKTLLERLVDRLNQRESLELEFKRGKGGLPKSLWPTVSSFANTNGGWIIIGVNDQTNPAELEGVKKPHVRLQDLHNLMRNPNKISYPICGNSDVEVERVADKPLIALRVPAASRKNKPIYINGNPYAGTYVRRNQGDYHATKPEVDRMMREASDVAADSAILPRLSVDDLDLETLERYRRRLLLVNPASPWLGYSDSKLLEAIDATGRDKETGHQGVTVAGLLMFGRDRAIREWRTRHLIDFRVRSANGSDAERWEDRVTWEGNLLGAFEAIYPRLVSDQPVRFRLEGEARVDESPTHVALREALVNLLVHTDYTETQASLIKRTSEGFVFRNPGSSRVPGDDLLMGDRSDPRNPLLVRMFRFIGLAEEAGTGLTQIVKLWRDQGLQMPRIDPGTERYEFGLELRYSHLLSEEDRQWLGELREEEWTEAEQLALVQARHKGSIDNQKLRRIAGLHSADATKVLGSLRDRGFLTKKGRGRWSFYELGRQAAVEEGQLTLLDSEGSSKGSSEDNSEDRLRNIAAPARESRRLPPDQLKRIIETLCSVRPLKLKEISGLVQRSKPYLRTLLRELMAEGRINFLYPQSPRHPDQRYLKS